MISMLVLALAFDLAAVSSEPNPERRSDKALQAASIAMDAARAAYNQGDEKRTVAALDEIRQSVDLSYRSLQESWKSPRSSEHHKLAEKAIRSMVRRLESFRDELSFAERASVEAVLAHVSEIHDEILNGIMTDGTIRK